MFRPRAYRLALIAIPAVLLSGCFDIFGVQTNEEPIVPSMLEGRPVEIQGTVTVTDREITLRVWDSATIDGDIISLFVNGEKVLNSFELTATKRSVSVTLDYDGYNYVAMYAHNEGDISPNTAALSIDDGTGEQTVVISANLSTNAAYNIVVE